MKESIIVFLFFLFGFITGHFKFFPESPIHENLAIWVIYFMLFTVGISIGFNARAWQIIRALKGKILLVPLGILIGTAIGGLVSWCFLKDMLLRDIMAIAFGLGYYSLSSMLITQFANPELGALALLVNMAREIIAMLLAPLFVRISGGLGPLSVAAAASEACLPIIIRTSGEFNAILAIFSGVVLTVCVPFILTLLYH